MQASVGRSYCFHRVAGGRATPHFKRVAIALERDNQDARIHAKYLLKNDLVKKKLLPETGDLSCLQIHVIALIVKNVFQIMIQD